MVGPSTSSARFITGQNLTNDVYQNTRYHDFKNLHRYKHTRSHLCSTCNSLSNKPAQLPSHVWKSVIVKPLASAMWHGLCSYLYWRKEQHCTAPWPPSATRTILDDQSRLVCPFIYDDFKNTATPRLTTNIFEWKFQFKISSPTSFPHSDREYLFIWRSASLWDFAQRMVVVCYRSHVRGASNRRSSSWITIIQ
jgi:hypothetical protein